MRRWLQSAFGQLDRSGLRSLVAPTPRNTGGPPAWVGLGQDQMGSKSTELPVEFRFRAAPDRPQGEHELPRHLPAVLELDAVIGHFLRVPAAPDAEEEAARRDAVERRNGLRQRDRMVLGEETHGRADLSSWVTAAAAVNSTKGSEKCL